MRIVRFVALLSAAASIAACADQGSDPRAAAALIIGDPLPVTRLRAEPYSLTYNGGMRTAQRLVIRDETTWRSTWGAIWGSLSPTPALPAVDFSREMIVVASLGERGTGGYSILVDSAVVASNGITVRVRSTSPGRACFVTTAFTQPVDAARLPRSDAPVHFAEVATVLDCG